MKKSIAAMLTACFFCFTFYCCTSKTTTSANADSTASATNMYNGYATQAEWGKHLMATGGCGDCHTPKKMTPQGPVDDSSIQFSGHLSQSPGPTLTPDQMKQGLAATTDLTAWIGPWGYSYAANLTPDSSGLASWTEEQFINCLTKGLFKGLDGSRPLMPPMPTPDVKNYTLDEMKAIFAYLKTVKPVHNIVPDYQPPGSK